MLELMSRAIKRGNVIEESSAKEDGESIGFFFSDMGFFSLSLPDEKRERRGR